MKHMSHPHELSVASKKQTDNKTLTCFGCKLSLFGTCYGCSGCNFYLHKFCFDLPQSAHFDSHPKHTLGLLYPPYCQGPCDACGESCDGFTYNCASCKYIIHANCATFLHAEPKNERDQYMAKFFGHKVEAMKVLASQLGSNSMMSGRKEQEEKAYRIQKEREAEELLRSRHNLQMQQEAEELRRRRHNLTMQQLKRASDSIDFMGQIGTSSNYTYRYY